MNKIWQLLIQLVKIIQKISFWLPHLFSIFGLLAAINSFIDMFFVDAVMPIPFSLTRLLPFTKFIFFIDPNAIFLLVPLINFELTDYYGNWIIFVDFDLFKSYFAFGNCSFKLFKFFGNFIVFNSLSSSSPRSYASCFISNIFELHNNYFA